MNDKLRAKLCQTRQLASSMDTVVAEERDKLERSRGETDRNFQRVQEEHVKIKG